MDEDELEQIHALLDDEEDDDNEQDSNENVDVEKQIDSSVRASSRPPTRPNGTLRNLKISGKMLTKAKMDAGKWKVMMAVLSSPYFWAAIAIIAFVILVVIILKAQASNTSSMIVDNVFDYVEQDATLSEEAKTLYNEKASMIKFPLTSINALYDRFISSDVAAEVLTGYTTILGTNEVSQGESSNSDGSNQTFTGSGNFTKYALSEDKLKQIARLCQQEQDSAKGAAAEASLMANRLELYGGTKYPNTPDGLYNYVKNSGWFYEAAINMKKVDSLRSDILEAVRSVLVDGKRTLPAYVDQHYTGGKWIDVENNGVQFDSNNRSMFIPHTTVVFEKNNNKRTGTNWIFYSFPAEGSDPFGYSSNENRQRLGESCYEFGS